MHISGIICEYNPLHLGHQKQFRLLRETKGAESAIVCLMSGNFVQRGKPALLDKQVRAKAAILSGADLVLELPAGAALSSAEGFAAGAVHILAPICQSLCFGAEHPDIKSIWETARTLLSPGFSPALRQQLSQGLSFPAARQAALELLGGDSRLLTSPNDILAVEYAKAVLSQNVPLELLPISRDGDYHSAEPDAENPSATFLRREMRAGGNWQAFVPPETLECYQGAPLHTLDAGERAVLARLRTMTEAEFAALPFGSEGLWRKLMREARRQPRLEGILEAVKSKRYTRTRLNRMLLCAYLGLGQEDLETPPPYIRILAFNNRGREILRQHKDAARLVNLGEDVRCPYQDLENRLDDLYGLFALPQPEPAGQAPRRRIFYTP
ncbi:MAG TPA: nucleotidyltransferase family protein [Candidatus Faecousia intestinigallinarum]|nr:nucleotidyltransferase family protein [Candidatus Faecousia intestinigallinarum]